MEECSDARVEGAVIQIFWHVFKTAITPSIFRLQTDIIDQNVHWFMQILTVPLYFGYVLYFLNYECFFEGSKAQALLNCSRSLCKLALCLCPAAVALCSRSLHPQLIMMSSARLEATTDI